MDAHAYTPAGQEKSTYWMVTIILSYSILVTLTFGAITFVVPMYIRAVLDPAISIFLGSRHIKSKSTVTEKKSRIVARWLNAIYFASSIIIWYFAKMTELHHVQASSAHISTTLHLLSAFIGMASIYTSCRHFLR